ncbi:hypothetical protein jhhlp_000978 [Lomentospora prolificans]|uniref:Uncharacterized protein n=1 Tax=Lomentospora prolificans TaxID=41688 RepID=A0A2N3NK04_9PEZI|nr:hypothetical protein jhhlp_000978 [Lomentospora prolificans]
MALPPKFAAHRVVFGKASAPHTSVPPAAHVLEVFLDYCCPFSAKIFKTLTGTVFPLIRTHPAWSSNLQVIFRQQVQPWHPSSTLMHEAAVVVNQQAPEKFWDFSEALFARATEFYDVNVVNETRNQTYARLAKIAGGAGLDEAKVLEALTIPSEPVEGHLNAGNKATNDLKLLVKMARLSGVHVSPTVIFDGVVQNDPFSSLYQRPLRSLTLTHKAIAFRAYSQTTKGPPLKQTQSTISAVRNPRPLTPNIYTSPDPNKKYALPEKVLIYHAGTGRVMYLAVLKLTTIFLSALFCGVFVPSYIADDKPWTQSAGLALCGIIPFVFVAFTTGPFVSHISIHLPPAARHSRTSLQRFVSSLPAQTRLEFTTLSIISKPRVSYLTAGDLAPAKKRMGIVNFERDTLRENAARKWWMFRAVGEFNVQGSNRGVKEGWIWEAIADKVKSGAIKA